MEKWQKDLLEMIETVADEVEQFFQDVTEMADSLFELSEELTEQIQNTIASELDHYLQALADPMFEMDWEMEEFGTEIDQPFPYKVEPTAQQHSACIGCHHYHGEVYGGNLLVCAMHPYGWDDASCPDWEQE